MIRKVIAVFAVFALSTGVFAGCATQTAEEHKGAMVGAGAGAVGGGIIGGVIGHAAGSTAAGVVIGSLVGGLAGAAVGHYYYDQKRTEDEAKKQYDYDHARAQANLVRVESVYIDPPAVSPGGKVELVATYTVLGPENATMQVTETREVRHNGLVQGRPTVNVERAGGTYESRIPLTLGPDAESGDYMVATTIESGGSSDMRESRFVVK